MFRHYLAFGPSVKYEIAKDFIENTTKQIKYTYGLGYRNPTTHNVPVTKDRAFEILKDHWGMLDIVEYDDYVHMNAYSSNDMW